MGVTGLLNQLVLPDVQYFAALIASPMRNTLLLLILLAASSLTAQTVLPIGEGWQVSVGLEINQRTRLASNPVIYVTAADTLPPDPADFLGFPRLTREIDLGNGPITFYQELNYDDTDRLAEALTQLIPSVRLHRRNAKGLEYSFGLFYSAYRRDQRLAGGSGLPDDYFIIQNETTEWRAGVRTSFVYNLLRDKRFQPYAGIMIDFGVNQSKYIRTYRQFPILGIEQDLGATVVERFRVNTLLDLDLSVTAGINYRLSERFALGLNMALWGGTGERSAGIQLRYLFRPKTTDNQP